MRKIKIQNGNLITYRSFVDECYASIIKSKLFSRFHFSNDKSVICVDVSYIE